MTDKKMTLTEMITGHRALWDYLAKTSAGVEDKGLWPGWGNYPECYNDCFACEWSEQHAEELGVDPCMCRHSCPLDWPTGQGQTWLGCLGGTQYAGLFGKWLSAETMEERKRYAEQIRDLPIRGMFLARYEEEKK